jgi:Ca2+:H+ antiporter
VSDALEQRAKGRVEVRASVRRKINLLLLAIPLALYLAQKETPARLGLPQEFADLAVFILSALSLMPLAGFVESAVEELAELLGQFVGGLLHTTFGNVAELIIGISILVPNIFNIPFLFEAHEPIPSDVAAEIVKASITGAVIRNSLLFLGLATIMGAWRNGKMKFDPENASEYSTVFTLAVIGLALPTIGRLIGAQVFKEETAIETSLVFAGVLLFSYIAYVLFSVFRVERSEHARKQHARGSESLPLPAQPDVEALFAEERAQAEARLREETNGAPSEAEAPRTGRIDPHGKMLEAKRQAREEEGETGLLAGHPVLRGLAAAVVLLVATFGVAVMSEHFVGTIEPVAKTFLGNNELFIGLIVIPVIGGVVELNGAIGMARRNRMEITMAVTAGASIQMILLVAPVLVLVGFFSGAPFDLIFQPLGLVVFLASSFVFMLLGRDGESTWLEGVQLTAFWLLVASTAFFLKG